jgi:urea transport system permease protein
LDPGPNERAIRAVGRGAGGAPSAIGGCAVLTPPARAVFTPPQWALLAAGFCAVGVLAPLAHALLPADHALRPSSYAVTLAGKFMCYAMLALAMDLIWGYAGILSLGQSLFFALGGYAFGMYLMRGIGREGQYQSDLPDFMVFLDWKALPWHWWNSDSFLWSACLVVAVPGVLAFAFGVFAFRSRIGGVYFSIITQALTFAAMLLFFRNETGFGGNNGFTDFKTLLGFRIAEPSTKAALLSATAVALFGTFVFARWLVTRKFGRVLQAIRDAESRTRFCGYDTVRYKLAVWTLAAVISGVAGALYVPQVGIINPSEMSPANSIEVAIWTAVGGRGTLIGPIVGAFLVNGAKSWFTQAVPEFWLFFLGGLFVAVTLFLPRGVISLFEHARGLRLRARSAADASERPDRLPAGGQPRR